MTFFVTSLILIAPTPMAPCRRAGEDSPRPCGPKLSWYKLLTESTRFISEGGQFPKDGGRAPTPDK